MEHFDLAIIGSGSGNSIPDELSDWKIALVEESTFGGTCLNKGCIPSKMFVLPADKIVDAQSVAKLGLSPQDIEADWAQIRDRVFGRIDPISEGGLDYRHSLGNISVFETRATFLSNNELALANGESISAERILIATGARPNIPPIDGLAETPFLTSDNAMRLESLPETMAIIGGGFIAAEMGHVFSAYGTAVTLFNRSDRMLKAQDSDISDAFASQFGERVSLRLGELPVEVSHSDEGFELKFEDGSVNHFEQLLVATGRTPNIDNLGLENTDIQTNGRIISVNSRMETSITNIWAIGDAANPYQLKHVANAEARVAFNNIANPDSASEVSYKAVPGAVFSYPQVASVGLTEQQATDQGADFVVGRTDYAGTAYGWALEDQASFCKVIVDRSTERLLGAHILGPQAASLLQIAINAMAHDIDVRALSRGAYYIHPALSEVVENALLDAVSNL